MPTADDGHLSIPERGNPRRVLGPTVTPSSRRVRPFLIGTAVGSVMGAVVGTLLSQSTRRLLVGLIHLVTRRLSQDERDELRFELLLQ